jgi:hypothetical protein
LVRRGGRGGEGLEGEAPDEALVGAGDESHRKGRGGGERESLRAAAAAAAAGRVEEERGEGFGGFCSFLCHHVGHDILMYCATAALPVCHGSKHSFKNQTGSVV